MEFLLNPVCEVFVSRVTVTALTVDAAYMAEGSRKNIVLWRSVPVGKQGNLGGGIEKILDAIGLYLASH